MGRPFHALCWRHGGRRQNPNQEAPSTAMGQGTGAKHAGTPSPKTLGFTQKINPKPMAKGSAAPRGAERWISSRDMATGDGDATSWPQTLAVMGALRPSRQQAKLCGFLDHKPDCEQPGNIHTACARPLLYRPSPRKARGSHDKPELPRRHRS